MGIAGIGIDIVRSARISRTYQKFGDRFLKRMLHPAEIDRFHQFSTHPKSIDLQMQFLATRLVIHQL